MSEVTFGYTSEKLVLKDVNIDVGLDSRIAIVGANGAGKSTLWVCVGAVVYSYTLWFASWLQYQGFDGRAEPVFWSGEQEWKTTRVWQPSVECFWWWYSSVLAEGTSRSITSIHLFRPWHLSSSWLLSSPERASKSIGGTLGISKLVGWLGVHLYIPHFVAECW